MADFNYGVLSGVDFEYLARDIFEAELGVTLEAFTPGRDQGIDLRHRRRDRNLILIQCKRYASNAYAALISSLRKELPKLEKLRPTRYIVATTVGLTPANKDAIVALFKGYMTDANDVYGVQDLDGAIRRHDGILRKNPKLWLASAEVLEAILQHNIQVRTESLMDLIKEELPLWVQNESFDVARQLLEDRHVCVISGPPGIGKTMLAHMLLASYTPEFEPVVLSLDVDEADQKWERDNKQLFYYDDFLGRTRFVSLPKNEDARLGDLIRRAHRSDNKRLVLTTREYILREAQMRYERLDQRDINLHKIVLDLEVYSRLHRGQILYNHVFFADVSREARSSLAHPDDWTPIVDHDGYSPRLLGDLTRLAKESGADGPQFAQRLLEVLDHPSELWDHIVNFQLSAEARALLIVLAFLPNEIPLDVAESAFIAFCRQAGLDAPQEKFPWTIRVLDGTFLRVGRGTPGEVLGFYNPSVEEYVLTWAGSQRQALSDLLASAQFFEQPALLDENASATDARQKGAAYPDLHRTAQGLKAEVIEAMMRTFATPPVGIFVVSGPRFGTRLGRLTTDERLVRMFEAGFTVERPDAREWLGQAVGVLDDRWRAHIGNKQAALRLLRLLPELDVRPETVDMLRAAAAGWFTQIELYPADADAFIELRNLASDVVSEREVDDFAGELRALIAADIADLDFETRSDLDSAIYEYSRIATLLGIDIEDDLERLDLAGVDLDDDGDDEEDSISAQRQDAGSSQQDEEAELRMIFSTLATEED